MAEHCFGGVLAAKAGREEPNTPPRAAGRHIATAPHGSNIHCSLAYSCGARRASVKGKGMRCCLLLFAEPWFAVALTPYLVDDREVVRCVVACGRLPPIFIEPLRALVETIVLHWRVWQQHLADIRFEAARDAAEEEEEVVAHMSIGQWWAVGED